MNRTEMITRLLNAFKGSASALGARRRRLQGMTLAGLKRELLIRGLAEYDEPEGCGEEEDGRDELVPLALLGITRGPLHAD